MTKACTFLKSTPLPRHPEGHPCSRLHSPSLCYTEHASSCFPKPLPLSFTFPLLSRSLSLCHLCFVTPHHGSSHPCRHNWLCSGRNSVSSGKAEYPHPGSHSALRPDPSFSPPSKGFLAMWGAHTSLHTHQMLSDIQKDTVLLYSNLCVHCEEMSLRLI